MRSAPPSPLRISWRYAFIALGRVGFFAAIAVLLIVREPRRGGLDRARTQMAPTGKSGFRQTLDDVLFACARSCWPRSASGATQFVTYGVGNFTTLFLMREKGMTLHQVAV